MCATLLWTSYRFPKICKPLVRIYYARTLVATLVRFEVGQYCSDNHDMINKVIKLKLQYFKHVYVQATCQRDPEVHATCRDPKIYLL